MYISLYINVGGENKMVEITIVEVRNLLKEKNKEYENLKDRYKAACEEIDFTREKKKESRELRAKLYELKKKETLTEEDKKFVAELLEKEGVEEEVFEAGDVEVSENIDSDVPEVEEKVF